MDQLTLIFSIVLFFVSFPTVFLSYRHHEPWNSILIFMEYASGGELFSKLKPDIGLSELEAQNYFRQLLEGVNYLLGVLIGSK